MTDSSIVVQGLGKRYRVSAVRTGARSLSSAIGDLVAAPVRALRSPGIAAKSEFFWALRDIDLVVGGGEVLGVIGPNGSGKSTLLKVLSRITSPTTGEAMVRGRVGSLLEVGTGFHPELTGRENIYLNGTLVGMRKREIDRRFDEIVDFADVGRFLDTPVKRYSSGMYIRLAFAVAAHLDAEVLLVDEVLAVGDQTFQRKCLGRMSEVSRSGRTVLFVSHNMAAVRSLCGRCILLEKGRIRLDGEPGPAIRTYLQRGTNSQSTVSFGLDEAPGNDYLRLVGLALRQEGTSLGAQVRSSLPLEIVMLVSVQRTSTKLQVGFELLTGDGTQVLQSFHTDQSGARALSEGVHELRCELQPGLLNEGTYILYPAAALYYESWILRQPHEAELRFEVMLDHPQSDMWYAAREGVLAPAIEWEAGVLDENVLRARAVSIGEDS